MRVHPNTQQVAVVSGGGSQDHLALDLFRQDMSAFANRVSFTIFRDLSMEELRKAVAHLPDHTIVLYLTMFRDATGRNYTPRQALGEFAPASRVPIYGCYNTYLGRGIVGGSMVTLIGRKAAQLGMRILAGEDPQSAARSEAHEAVPMFD
ncbi:MAG: hypothetical protein WBX20_11600 [Terrimicrobiaceae bacterium]